MHAINHSGPWTYPQSQALAERRKKDLICAAIVCYPCAAIKATWVGLKNCPRVVTERRQPLCVLKFFEDQECWDGQRPLTSNCDFAQRVINPCVCCIKWNSLPCDYFLFPEEIVDPPPPPHIAMDEPPTEESTSSTSSSSSYSSLNSDGPDESVPPPSSPEQYPYCFAIPGLGGGE